MSWWTYINGIIIVQPMGRTNPEKRYILDTVLEHLPKLTGSEKNMFIYVIEKKGHSSASSCNEFGKPVYSETGERKWVNRQDTYILVVNGGLRNHGFNQTLKEFNKWLCRLSKRVMVRDVLVELEGYEQKILLRNKNNVYRKMFEDPSWVNKTGEPTWCEYLMWDPVPDTMLPLGLVYKYYNNEECNKEFERRSKWGKGKKEEED